MSTTLLDFPARLLDLPRQPLGPQPISDLLDDTRRVFFLTRNLSRALFHGNDRGIGSLLPGV
jgi:hypothetical protein